MGDILWGGGLVEWIRGIDPGVGCGVCIILLVLTVGC